MWQKLANALNWFVLNVLKKPLVSAILTALGLSGSVWTWIASLLVTIGWKKANKEIQSEARLEDQKNIDDKVSQTHQGKLNNEATSEDSLIESELDTLNGGRH